MRTLDPRLVLIPACATVALLWSMTTALTELAAATPWLIVLAAPTPVLTGPLYRWLSDPLRILLGLLAISLLITAFTTSPTLILFTVGIALLTVTVAIRESAQSPLSPDAMAAALAVSTALWLGMQGVAIAITPAWREAATLWLPLLLAVVLIMLAVTQLSPAPLTDRTGSAQWLLVAVAAVPAWTFIPHILTASTQPAYVVVPLLLGCAVCAMALLPLISPQAVISIWLPGVVLAAFGIQFAETAVLASALGVLVTPFALRYIALGWLPTAQVSKSVTSSPLRSGAPAALAAFVGLIFLAMETVDRWPTTVHLGAVVSVVVLLISLVRGTRVTNYQQATASALHWPGATAGLVAVALFFWQLS